MRDLARARRALFVIMCVAVAALATAGGFTAASPGRGAGHGTLNPAAPPETAQFSFIVGTWDCATRFMRPDLTWNEGKATWTGYYILDGWAIQDDWVAVRPDGTESHGTNIRSFNKRTGKWDNRWLPQGSLEWASFESEMVGGSMVMTGSGTDARGEFIDRNTFHDIRPGGWKWRKDRSYDSGETWIEVGFITASRRADYSAGGQEGWPGSVKKDMPA